MLILTLQSEPRFDTIPRELKHLAHWTLLRIKLDGENALLKIPYQAQNTNQKASPTNPNTWSSFGQAQLAFQAAKGKFAGIQFALTKDSHITIIDIEQEYYFNTDGSLTSFAQRVIILFNSYTECSLHHGLHIIIYADKGDNANLKLYR
jgi:primase-polymerase (primpol)-like protein